MLYSTQISYISQSVSKKSLEFFSKFTVAFYLVFTVHPQIIELFHSACRGSVRLIPSQTEAHEALNQLLSGACPMFLSTRDGLPVVRIVNLGKAGSTWLGAAKFRLNPPPRTGVSDARVEVKQQTIIPRLCFPVGTVYHRALANSKGICTFY